MIEREYTGRKKVSTRTIIAAIAMLVGVVLMAFGYFLNRQPLIYLGAATTLSGVLTEAVIGIIGGASKPS